MTQGNALLPPGQQQQSPGSSSSGLKEIHARLQEEAHTSWKRKDIWGLLAASYSLLLRSSLSDDDDTTTAMACFEAPANFKSFTFCRLTLLPALERLRGTTTADSICETSEFCLSVMADFCSKYLNTMVSLNDLPISRNQWLLSEQEDLRLRRQQQVQERQFRAWSRQTDNEPEEVIPASVDLTKRPDCLDDILALCTAVASLGEDYALCFWEIRTEDNQQQVVTLSRALLELERHQAKENSLLPSYLGLLAALSNSPLGATVVHEMLFKPSLDDASSTDSSARPKVSWVSILEMIRWFAKELSPQDFDGVATSTAASTGQSSPTSSSSTAYYYFDEPSSSGINSSNTASEKKSSTSASTKPKELGESNEGLLSAHLALIKNVATQSATARCDLLSMKLPLSGSSTTAVVTAGGDETLLVMFLLAIAPMSPAMRGAVFQSIASLLLVDGANESQRKVLKEMGQNAWHYLESCQILPISLLEQYPKPYMPENQRRPGLNFPPSSTSLAAGGQQNAVFASDPSYGIIYEMEHVESHLGYYPSTEGFCTLLSSLVASAGCPSKLGETWRDRPGCAPYVEFVMDFLLPRASGTSEHLGMPGLSFRLKVDQNRLVSHALELLHTVLARYSIPSVLAKGKPEHYLHILGLQAVVDEVVVAVDEDEAKTFMDDFVNKSLVMRNTNESNNAFGQVGLSLPNISSSGVPQSARVAMPAIPAPKSPGFAVLADILSSRGGNIFRAISRTLTDFSADGSFEADKASLSYALFGDTPPTTSSAKAGVSHGDSMRTLQNFLKPILPPISMLNLDPFTFQTAASQRETSVATALSIMCAVAAREESFYAVVNASKDPLNIVPTLKFHKKASGASGFRLIDVHLSRLTTLLFSSQSSADLRDALVRFVGYSASSPVNETKISSAALSIFFFAYQTKLHHQSIRSLCGHGTAGEKRLARSFATRLLESSKRHGSERDTQMISLLMNLILNEVREVEGGSLDLSQVVLGLPTQTGEGNWVPGQSRGSSKPADCFDAVIEIVNDRSIASHENLPQIVVLSYEVLFRLYDLLRGGDPAALRIVLYTAERLRSTDFFARNAVSLLRQENSDAAINEIHSKAWFLKTLASELRLLVGFASTSQPDSGLVQYLARFLSPRPAMCERLLSLLFDSETNHLKTFVSSLPLAKMSMDPSLPTPDAEALRAATFQLPGARDVVDGYQQIDAAKLLRLLKSKMEEEKLLAWVDQWNIYSQYGCAAGHATDALRLLMGTAANCLTALSQISLGSSQNRMLALPSSILTNVLIECLGRLLEGEGAQLNRGMDFGIYSGASCNLSSTVLLLVQFLASDPSMVSSFTFDSSDMTVLCGLLADTVTYSAIGDDSSHDSPMRYERTSILGSALATLLRHISKTNPDIIDQCQESIVNASRSLARYSKHPVFTDKSDSLSVTSLIARASLGEIIQACKREDDSKGQSVVYKVMSKDFCYATLDLLASLDDNMAQLLKVVAAQPFGCEILLQSGLFPAMIDAAQKYSIEEARIVAKEEGPNATFPKNTIRPPRHLEGHIKLLSAMMAAPGLSNTVRSDIAKNSLQVLQRYNQVFKKLCYSFPLDGEILRCFLNCLAQSMVLSQPISDEGQKLLASSQISKVEKIFTDGKFLQNGVIMLCDHLSANPLPKELLPPLPTALNQRTAVESSLVVNISSSTQQTWWNVIEALSTKDSNQGYGFNGDQYEYAIAATEILTLSLTLLKRADALEAIDAVSFARGLCRISDAFKLISQRLASMVYPEPTTSSGMDDVMDTGSTMSNGSSNPAMEAAYLKLLRTKLERCLEDLLVIALMRVRGLKKPRDMHLGSPEWTEFVNALSIALDHAGIANGQAVEASKFSNTLCQQLRKEMK
jgi:hypothetical protein